jgi:hypothetical protein
MKLPAASSGELNSKRLKDHMKKIIIPLLIILVFAGQIVLTASGLDFRFIRKQSPKIEQFSKVAEKFYLDQLNDRWKNASRNVYGHVEDALDQRYYPWTEISTRLSASKIEILRILPFQSSDASIEGYLAFVRYLQGDDQSVDRGERFFIDAWFVSEGDWVVSPSTLFLMDGTFVPVSQSSAYASFISEDSLNQRIQAAKVKYEQSRALNGLSEKEQKMLDASRDRVNRGQE